MDEERDEELERHIPKSLRLTGKILRWTGIALVILINAVLLWRVFFSDIIPKNMLTLTPNAALQTVYAAQGEQTVVFSQDNEGIATHKTDNSYYTCFWVKQAVYIPEAHQVQILVAYNNSALRNIQEDFGLDEAPTRADTVLDVTLVGTYSQNPDDPDAQKTSVRYTASGEPVEDSTLLYNYRRYVFDNVDFDDIDVSIEDRTTVEITVQFYYAGRVNYDRAPYSTVSIYNHAFEDIPVELSKRDVRALDGAAQ